LLAFILALAVGFAHAETRFCNSALPAAGEPIDPPDLFWDVHGGGVSDIVSPSDAIVVLNSLSRSPNSQCQIETVVMITDIAGNVLDEIEGAIDNNGTLLALEREFSVGEIPAGQRSVVFTDIEGTATGCTTDELRSFSVVTQKLEAPEVEAGDLADEVNIKGFGSFLVKKRDVRIAGFRHLVGNGAASGDGKAVGQALQLDCPGGTKLVPKYAGDEIDPLDLVWELAGGGTSQIGEDEHASLLVAVSPDVINQACWIPGRGEVLPKVEVEITATYEQGPPERRTGVLDASNPAQFFPLVEGMAEERQQVGFSVRAISPGCVAAHGGRVDITLRTESMAPGNATRVEQRLPVVVRKVPPEPILEGDILN
jgi:hypothetical protein